MLLQRLITAVFAVLVAFIFQANSAYAEINCFPQGTKIAAPNVDVSIEDIHLEDLITEYSFDSNKEANYTVKNISQESNIGSFLLNNTIKSSGNNLVYLYSVTKHRITTVQKLQKYRHILSRNNQDFEIDSIRHIVDASECIQI